MPIDEILKRKNLPVFDGEGVRIDIHYVYYTRGWSEGAFLSGTGD